MEQITGCEQNNSYKVYELVGGEKGKKMFKCKVYLISLKVITNVCMLKLK